MKGADETAADGHIVVIRTTPCTERLLIGILEPAKRISSWSSPRLKSYFEKNYIPNNKRTDVRAYRAIFSKEILDGAKDRLPELKEIIDIF